MKNKGQGKAMLDYVGHIKSILRVPRSLEKYSLMKE